MPSLFRSSRAPAPTPLAGKARFWDRIARKYAADPVADLAGYEATLTRVQTLLAPEHAVLEVGCGTGSTALRLAAGVRQYLATDVSTAMVDIARHKLSAQARPLPQLRFAVADAEANSVPCNSQDIVLALNLLHLVSDLDTALRGLVQALRPGGLLISKTACVGEMNPWVTRLALPLMRMIGRAPHVLLFDAAALEAAFVRCGFVVEEVARHGTQGRDIRVFVVARKPAAPSLDSVQLATPAPGKAA